MNFLSYLRVELRRIFLSRNTRLVMLLTLLTPLIGFVFYEPATQLAVTRAGEFIGNPTLAGAIGGIILFTLLTLFELDKVHKNHVDKLTDSIVSPVTMYLTKMISLLTVATVTGCASAVLYLPYTLYKVGYLFDWSTYSGCWFIVFLPALWISCLLAAVFYQIVRRMDLSLVLVIAVAIPCFTAGMHYDFILRWINPDMHFISDMFGNAQALRMAAWNRAFWLAALAGLYIISLLCVRRYGKSAFDSFLNNSKRFYKPIIGVALVALAAQLYISQPFVSRAAPGYDRTLYYNTTMQYSSPISLAYTMLSAYTLVEPDIKNGTINASSTWTFVNRDIAPKMPVREADKPFEMYMQINSGLTVYSVTANGVPLDFTDPQEDFMGVKFVTFDMPYSLQQIDASNLYGEGATREGIELVVEYGGYPTIWRHDEMSGFFGAVVSPQYLQFATYVGRSNSERISEVLPVFWPGWAIGGGAMSAVFDIVLPANLIPVNHYHGTVLKPWVHSENEDGTQTWRFTDVTATFREVYAADYLFERIEFSNGRGIDFYYARKNREAIEKYNAFKTVGDIYEYCLNGISEKAPELDLVFIQTQSPGEIEFSEDTLAGQWGSASGQGSMAYQIIQQWWTGIRFVPESNRSGEQVAEDIMGQLQGLSPYLREWNMNGIIEYIAYRFAKESFGEELANAAYVDVWKQHTSDYYKNFYTRNPEYKGLLSQRYFNTLAQKEREALDYYIMPLKLYKAEQIVGEDRMTEIIRQMYKETYDNRERPIQPLSSITVDEFWVGQSIPRPAGEVDEYFTQLYEMTFGQAEMPRTRGDFNNSVPLPRVVLEKNGLGRDDGVAEMLELLHSTLLSLYDGVLPTLVFTEFLELCGITADDLELTSEDLLLY